MKKFFTVRANETLNGISKGATYKVYSVTFPKLNPEGLFYIFTDLGVWRRISSSYFEPIDEV